MVAFSTGAYRDLVYETGKNYEKKAFSGIFVRECLGGDKSYVSVDETDIIAVWI